VAFTVIVTESTPAAAVEDSTLRTVWESTLESELETDRV
jgi:hypothetical protein